MPKRKYLFRIKNAAGQYYFVDPIAGVTTSPDPQNLVDSVASWKAMQLLWERDKLYRGIFRRYAPEQFTFVNDAAKILRYIFNTQGHGEAVAHLEIMKWKKSTLSYVLLDVFQFNFGKHHSEKLYVRETVMEGGLTQRVNAYDTTDFGIKMMEPGANPEFQYMQLDGILLTGKYNYVMMTGEMGIPGGAGLTFPLVYVDQEGRLPFGIPNMGVVPGSIWPTGDFDEGYLFKVMSQYIARVNIKFSYYIVNLSPDVTSVEVWVEIRGKKPGVTSLDNLHLVDIDISGGIGSSGDIDISTPWWDYSTNDMENYIFIYFKCLSSSGDGVRLSFFSYNDNERQVEIEYKHRQAQTVTRVISHWELFKKLVGRISGNELAPPAASTLLTTDVYPDDSVYNLNPFNTYFAPGDALRGLPTAEGVAIGDTEAELVTNFSDLVQHGLVSNCAGVGIEIIDDVETVVYEHLSHFFRDELIYDFGSNIKDFRMTLYDKYLGNSIKAGYDPQTYDEVNGRYEFNSQASFKAPVIQTIKDLNYVSPYRADCYGVEYTRINLEGKKTTDSTADNDTFIIQSNGSAVEIPGYTPDPKIIDRAHTISAGIPSEIAETVFNVPFTLQREMGRMLPFLSANFYGIPDTTLTYEAKSKNAAVVASMYAGADIVERANINMVSPGMLWKPIVFSYTAPASLDINDVMMTGPYGYMRIKVVRRANSCVLEGFVLKAGLNPVQVEALEFDLICAPWVDIPDWL